MWYECQWENSQPMSQCVKSKPLQGIERPSTRSLGSHRTASGKYN